jgi:hypothetical protein
VFIAMPFLDRLGLWLPSAGGLGRALAIVALGALGCYSLFYYLPALWGWRAGQRLTVVAASTFGTKGSEWIAGVGVGLGAVLLYAVCIATALRFTMLGLVSCGLTDASALRGWQLGSIPLESPIFLLTAAFWIFITGTASLLGLAPVIFALMQVYTPVALVLLGITATLASLGPGTASTAPAGLGGLRLVETPAGHGGLALLQWIFGYFAFSGLFSVEWGMSVRRPRDVRIGGWLGIILAGTYCASMALLTASGARPDVTGAHEGQPLVQSSTFHDAILNGIGGILGGAILMLFGLATLAPACYLAWTFSSRLASHWGRLRRFHWTWLGGAAAFGLIAVSWTDRLGTIFTITGAAFAPALGALSADALSQRLRWNGIRAGWHAPGLLAWGLGLAVGLLPLLPASAKLTGGWPLQPAALDAYLVSLVAYTVLSLLGPDGRLVPLPAGAEVAEGSQPVAAHS